MQFRINNMSGLVLKVAIVSDDFKVIGGSLQTLGAATENAQRIPNKKDTNKMEHFITRNVVISTRHFFRIWLKFHINKFHTYKCKNLLLVKTFIRIITTS